MTDRSRLLAALLLAGATTACAGTDPIGYDFQKEDGEGELGLWVHSGLYNRTYELHTPPGMDPEGSHPLIIFLHGSGDAGWAFRRRLRADALTDAARAITVWPDGMENTWTVGCADDCTFAQQLQADDVTFLEVLIRHLASELPVDTTRVYLMGFSQGGQLAQLYGCEGEIPPAGVGAVSAQMYKAAAARCAPKGPFPVGIVHGTGDPIAFYGGFGPGSVVMSVPETIDLWLGQFGCTGSPTEEYVPDSAEDPTSASIYRFRGCAPRSSVTLYQVYHGGHNWPGNTGPWPPITGLRSRNLDATREFLDLFGLLPL